MASGNQVILDTTVLSNFAYIDEMDFLARSYDNVLTVDKVVEELQNGVEEGYTFLERALDSTGNYVASTERENPPIKVGSIPESTVEDALEQHNLDPGEAHALVYCGTTIPSVSRMLATDDHDARKVARQVGIPLTGSVGFLGKGVEEGEFSLEQADEWLQEWVDGTGYFSPVDSVAEILPDDADY